MLLYAAFHETVRPNIFTTEKLVPQIGNVSRHGKVIIQVLMLALVVSAVTMFFITR